MKMRAKDPNNNHAILDLVEVAKATYGRWWCVALAVEQLQDLTVKMESWVQRPDKRSPLRFMADTKDMTDYMKYIDNEFKNIAIYLGQLRPAAATVVNFDMPSMAAKLRNLRRQVHSLTQPPRT